MTAVARVLVIEDNRDLALGLRVNLEERGYDVSVAGTAAAGLAKLRQARPHLVILDLSLPDGNGLDLMRRLRAAGDETLVLVLTANGAQDTKVRGLRLGADDYVTKPFDLEELLARIEVLLRRARPTQSDVALPPESTFELGDVRIDTRARTISRAGVELAVSRMGFDLLLALIRRRGSVVSRAELMREVWGYGNDVVTRTLDTHIFELRRLLEPEPTRPRLIKTVWRVGYRVD